MYHELRQTLAHRDPVGRSLERARVLVPLPVATEALGDGDGQRALAQKRPDQSRLGLVEQVVVFDDGCDLFDPSHEGHGGGRGAGALRGDAALGGTNGGVRGESRLGKSTTLSSKVNLHYSINFK